MPFQPRPGFSFIPVKDNVKYWRKKEEERGRIKGKKMGVVFFQEIRFFKAIGPGFLNI